MRQLRAFCARLIAEGEIGRPVAFALPKTPFRRLEVLTGEQAAAAFRSRHLTSESALAKRNRAPVASCSTAAPGWRRPPAPRTATSSSGPAGCA